MTEAKPLTLMQDEIAEIVRRGATENERRLIATIDERDEQIEKLMSGDIRREIENAAYERAMTECAEFAKEQRVHHGPYAYASNAALQCRHRIRSLIQPPAQKENGE